MKTINLALYICFIVVNTVCAQTIELKDNFFYIDGEKFFVKGVGYELSVRPGEAPWDNIFDAEILHFDMQRISEAGFSTIRTWKELPVEALDIIQQYNIKVLMGLGIWVADDGILTDPSFMESQKQRIASVLDYTKNYPNIIGYLIMNEPLPQIIKRSEYPKVIQFWDELKELIYQGHPGIPVSYANTCNGSFINPDYFDFTSYNAYYYSPVSIYHLHGYQNYINTLVNSATNNVPLIVTEFGLSVSPTGYGVAYGGNSLDEQAEGVIGMYQKLINGGAAGGCVFQYADGWWKGGEKYTQEDTPEEYFGIVSFSDLDDRYGSTRPVWDSLKMYNSAIITQPHSHEIYDPKIPIEIFLTDTIKKLIVMGGTMELYNTNISNLYVSDTIELEFNELSDTTLQFYFFDANENLVKQEEKIILLSKHEPKMPIIQVSVNSDYKEKGSIEVEFFVDKTSDLEVSNNLDYIYYPSIDFNEGYFFSADMGNESTFTKGFSRSIEENAVAITVGGAVNATFGKFKKRIVSEQILLLMDEETTQAFESNNSHIKIYPNPASNYIYLEIDNEFMNFGQLEIFSNAGQLIKRKLLNEGNEKISIKTLESGMYFWVVKDNNGLVIDSDKLVVSH